MKAKLIKVDKGYYNLEDEKGNILGTSYQFNSSVGDVLEYKLSKKNCDEIFGIVDIEKLCKQEAEKLHDKSKHEDWDVYNCLVYEDAEMIKIGFNKAMELNKDKLFTLSNLRKAFNSLENHPNRTFTELVALLQPTEIEVEIITEEFESYDEILNQVKKPILDSEGCLILKKI
jgi:hypothetical protein